MIAHRREKIFSSYISDNRVVYRTCQEFLQLKNKKINSPIKNWAKLMNRLFYKEDIFKWPLNT